MIALITKWWDSLVDGVGLALAEVGLLLMIVVLVGGEDDCW